MIRSIYYFFFYLKFFRFPSKEIARAKERKGRPSKSIDAIWIRTRTQAIFCKIVNKSTANRSEIMDRRMMLVIDTTASRNSRHDLFLSVPLYEKSIFQMLLFIARTNAENSIPSEIPVRN